MEDIDIISDFLSDGISAVLNWFEKLIDSVPGLALFVSSFLIMVLLTRFLLSPIMGKMSLGSDVAGTGLIRSKHSESSSTSTSRSGYRSSYYRNKGNKDK